MTVKIEVEYSYDSRCEDLAREFILSDTEQHPSVAENIKRIDGYRSLAQAIQDAVEDWYDSHNAEIYRDVEAYR